MKNFGNLLGEARERAGLTQKELAGQAGVDHSYISKIERGVYDPPSRDKVLAIADVLGIFAKAERAYFLLAAGCANIDDLEKARKESIGPEKDTSAIDEAFYFPVQGDLETEVLVDRIRQLIRNPTLSKEERDKLIEILSSFLDWLTFRVYRKE